MDSAFSPIRRYAVSDVTVIIRLMQAIVLSLTALNLAKYQEQLRHAHINVYGKYHFEIEHIGKKKPFKSLR
jgi:uncharacterized membrane protein